MYRGFNISGISVETFSGLNFTDHSDIHDGLTKCGVRIGSRYKNSVEDSIRAIERNGKVEFAGNEIEGLCFPHLNFDVFISHSHSDVQTAVELAGFLKYWCGLDAFVDSCAWSYRDEIIERLVRLVARDDKPSEKLLCSIISHVDCMLNKALIGMIDGCESLFFLNTPNSILGSSLGGTTCSPWIYGELEASRVIRKQKSERRPRGLMEARAEDCSPYLFQYDIRLNHLASTTGSVIRDWAVNAHRKGMKKFDALDALYDCFPFDGESF